MSLMSKAVHLFSTQAHEHRVAISARFHQAVADNMDATNVQLGNSATAIDAFDELAAQLNNRRNKQ